jgi:hypothetical protein
MDFQLLKCKNCEKELAPLIRQNLSLYYKTVKTKNNVFNPIICDNCIEIIKNKFNIKKKSLEICKYKYGEDYYKQRWEEHDTSSLNYFINKYGEEKGKKKFEIKCSKTNGSIDNFIKRYGKRLGLKKFEIFKNKSKHTKEKNIELYGEKEGNKRWKEYLRKKKETSHRSLTYWLEKTNGDYNLAKKLLAEAQRRDLNFFINKYGTIEGKNKFLRYSLLKKTDLNSLINKYGVEKGTIAYNKKIKLQKGRYTLEWYVKKFGEKKGKVVYEKRCKLCDGNSLNFLLKKFNGNKELAINEFKRLVINRLTKSRPFSVISQELFKKIYEEVKNEYKEIYFGSLNKEYSLNDNKKIIFLDFFIKDINLYIEFFGDFWHANPNIYKENDYHIYKKKNSKEIWEEDKKRINFLNTKLNGLVIWEKDFKNNKEETVKFCIKYIKENSYGRNS